MGSRLFTKLVIRVIVSGLETRCSKTFPNLYITEMGNGVLSLKNKISRRKKKSNYICEEIRSEINPETLMIQFKRLFWLKKIELMLDIK